MKNNKPLASYIFIIISVLLNIIAVLLIFSRLNASNIWAYTWSDTLYLASIFQDVFIDKSGFSGWHLNGAPNFFPDMFIYFIIRAFTFNFLQASLIFSLVQVTIIIVLGYNIYKQILPKASPIVLSVSMLGMLIFQFVFLIRGDFIYTFYLISITYHTGAYIMMLLALFLTIRYAKTNKIYLLVILILIQILGSVCDKLFILLYSLPIFTSFILFVFIQYYRKLSITICMSIIVTTITGTLIYNAINWATSVSIISISNKVMEWSNIKSSYQVLWKQHAGYFNEWDIRGLINILVIASFLISIGILVKKLSGLKNNTKISFVAFIEVIYLIFIVVNTLLVFNAPALNGYYPSPALMRYNIYPLYLNIINYTYIVYKFSIFLKKPKIKEYFGYVLLSINSIIIIVIFIQTNIREELVKFIYHYPTFVENIDKIANDNNLKYGVSNYSIAKYTTMFSKTGLRIYHTHENMRPWHHVTNENWYYGSKKGKHKDPRFNFIILDGLFADSVANKVKEHIIDTLFIEEDNLTIIITDPFVFERITKKPIFY